MTTEETIALAREKAEDLAGKAAPADLLFGVVNEECGPAVLADLLAHELAASHRLMQRIAAFTDGILSWSAEVNGAGEATDRPAGDRAAGHRVEPGDLAAARLAGVAGRLMEQMRLGLVALRRLRPDLPADEEGIWLALRWNEERCSSEELERRLAAAKAARAQWADPPARKARPLSARAQAVRADAMAVAADLAKEAGVAELAVAVADEGNGLRFLGQLFVFELGAIHDLTMRLAGCADRAFDRAIDTEEEPTVALQLSTVAARLGDRFRRGLLTLQSLAGGGPDKPRKVIGTIWAGPEPSLHSNAAAIDSQDQPVSAPAASISAGHGVHRSDSQPASGPGHDAPQAAA
jgi:hypothetical protein